MISLSISLNLNLSISLNIFHEFYSPTTNACTPNARNKIPPHKPTIRSLMAPAILLPPKTAADVHNPWPQIPPVESGKEDWRLVGFVKAVSHDHRHHDRRAQRHVPRACTK